VIRNDFEATQGVAFFPKKPDPSTYFVRDSEGVEVLRLRYMNPRAIRLTGRFLLPSGGVVEVSPDEIGVPGNGVFRGGGTNNVKTAIELCGRAGP